MENELLVVFSKSTDPFYNMALEEYIFKFAGKNESGQEYRHIILFWKNRDAIIVGCNQDTESECFASDFIKSGGHIVRRKTGGGAVYHDLGNLNFSFLQSCEIADKDKNMNIIKEAIMCFGVEADVCGRNDILAEGKKVSGNAFMRGKTRNIHHGTLLLDSNLNRMNSMLKVKQKNYSTERIASVSARVANLSSFCPDITEQSLKEKIIHIYFSTYSCTNIVYAQKNIIRDEILFQRLVEQYRVEEMKVRDFGTFTDNVKGTFSWGRVDVWLDICDKKIGKIIIFSDALEYDVVQTVEKELCGIRLIELQEILEQKQISNIKRDIVRLMLDRGEDYV